MNETPTSPSQTPTSQSPTPIPPGASRPFTREELNSEQRPAVTSALPREPLRPSTIGEHLRTRRVAYNPSVAVKASPAYCPTDDTAEDVPVDEVAPPAPCPTPRIAEIVTPAIAVRLLENQAYDIIAGVVDAWKEANINAQMATASQACANKRHNEALQLILYLNRIGSTRATELQNKLQNELQSLRSCSTT